MILRDYQVTSFEWMIGNYRRRTNVILGDEMGLGKTAQCISVMEHVRTEQLRAPRPFLSHRAVDHLGALEARDRGSGHERRSHGRQREGSRDHRVDRVFGSPERHPERARRSSTSFWYPSRPHAGSRSSSRPSSGPRASATRLTSSRTSTRLPPKPSWRLATTGFYCSREPRSKNNVKELFGIMHVLDPEKYPSWEHFQESMLDGGGREVDAEQVMRLREVLKPRMLRRMKGTWRRFRPRRRSSSGSSSPRSARTTA